MRAAEEDGEFSKVKMVSSLFSNLGLSVIIEESQMHAIVGVSGSGPAYVFAFIEALADAGVRMVSSKCCDETRLSNYVGAESFASSASAPWRVER